MHFLPSPLNSTPRYPQDFSRFTPSLTLRPTSSWLLCLFSLGYSAQIDRFFLPHHGFPFFSSFFFLPVFTPLGMDRWIGGMLWCIRARRYETMTRLDLPWPKYNATQPNPKQTKASEATSNSYFSSVSTFFSNVICPALLFTCPALRTAKYKLYVTWIWDVIFSFPPPFSSLSTHQPSYGISSCLFMFLPLLFLLAWSWSASSLTCHVKRSWVFLHVMSIRYVPFLKQK